MRIIPRRHGHIVFGLFLSGMMTLVVTAIATANAIGLGPGFLGRWMGSWISSWAVAFPLVLVAAPAARRMVERMTRLD